MSDVLELVLEATLDKSDESVSRLKKDAEELSKKLKSEKLSIGVELDESTLNALEDQVKKVGEAINTITETANFSKLQEQLSQMTSQASDFEAGVKNIAQQTNLLSDSTKFDFLNDSMYNIKEIQTDLLTTQKTLIGIDSQGKKIADEMTETINVVNAQKEAYGDLKKTLTTINTLENARMKSTGDSKEAIDYQLKVHKDQVKAIQDTIDAYNIRNKELDNEIASTEKLRKIQKEIKAEKSEDQQSKKAYSELTKAIKEEGKILKDMVGTEGEINAIYKERLSTVRRLRTELEGQIGKEGLENTERELKLKKEIDKITADITLKESKRAEKEQLRIEKLNERLVSLQELTGSDGFVKLKGKQDELEQYVLGMKELREEAKDGELKLISYQQGLDSAGNAQAKMTVQARQGKGMVKEYKLVLDEATQSMYKLGENTRETSNRSLEFSQRMVEALKRTVQWGISTKSVQFLGKQIGESVRQAKELDKELTQVKIVTGATTSQTDKLKESYFRLGHEMGKTAKEISELNTNLIRQGLSAEEAMRRMQTTLQFSATSGMSPEQTLKIITSGVNAMGEEADKLADVLLKAGNVSASSAEEVGESLTRVASSAETANLSLEQTTAITSTLIEVTQESPSSLGNSLKTLISRFNKIDEETGKYNESLNQVQEAFESVGVTFLDSNKQIRPFYDLLEDLDKIWVDLDKNTKNYIATTAAGANQRNRFLAIMNNFNRTQEIHNDLLAAEGTLHQSYGEYIDSVEAKYNKLEATMERLRDRILDSETLGFAIETLDSIINLFTEVNNQGHSVASFLATMTAGSVIVKKLARNIDLDLVDAFSIVDKEGNLFTTNLKIMGKELKEVGVKATLAAGAKKLFAGSSAGATTVTNLSIGALIKNAAALTAVRMAAGLATGVLVSFAVKGIGKVINSAYKSREELQEMGKEMKAAVGESRGNIATLEVMSDRFDELQEKIHSVTGTYNMTNEEQEEYFRMAEKISGIAPETVQRFDEKGNAVIKYGTNLEKLIEVEKELIDLERRRVLNDENKFNKQFDKTRDSAQKEIDELQKKLDQEQAVLDRQLTTMDAYGEGTGNYTRLTKEVEERRGAIQELRVEQEMLNAEIREAKEEHSAITDAYMMEIEGIDGVTESLQNLIRNRAEEKLMEDGSGADKEYILGVADAIKKYQIAVDGLDLDQTVPQTKELMSTFREMGMPIQEAEMAIYELAISMEGLNLEMEGAGDLMGAVLERVESYSEEIDKLSKAYQTLAQGQSLTASETMDLIMEYDELAEIVLESGELTIEHLEDLEEVMDKVYEARIMDLRAIQKQSLEEMKKAEQTISYLETILSFMESIGIKTDGVSSIVSRAHDKLTKDLSRLQAEYEKTEKQIEAIGKVQDTAFQDTKMKNYQTAYKAAANNVKNLQGILKDLNEQGQLTQEVANRIIDQYPELIWYLDNEAMLRQKIIEKIEQETSAQENHYRNMLLMTDDFAIAFYNKHSALIDDVARIYNIDLKNFESVTQAKIAMMNAFIGSFNQAGLEMRAALGGGTEADIAMLKELLAMKQGGHFSGAGQMWSKFSQQQKDMSISDIKSTISMLEAMNSMSQLAPSGTVSKLPSVGSGGAGASGSAGSKGGGSNKTIQHIEEIELLTDRYLKFEKALDEVNRSIEYNEALLELSSGEDRIKQMEKANNLLREQQRLLNLRATEERKELRELENTLKKKINLYDGTFGADSFNAYTKQMEKDINGIIKTLNVTYDDATRDSLSKSKDKLEKEYREMKEQFDTYVALRTSIPDLGKEWWLLEYEVLANTLEAVDFRYDLYNEQVEHLAEQLDLILKTKKTNVDELAMELEIMESIKEIQQDSLKDIETQSKKSRDRVVALENQLERLGNNRGAQYETTMRNLIMARAEQDKYFEHYKIQLNALAEQQRSLIGKYSDIVTKAKEETLEALEDIRVKFDGFDFEGFENSIGNILADLNKLDKIFIDGAMPNLDTTNARDDLDSWRTTILDSVQSLEKLKNEIELVSNVEVDSREASLEKQKQINELIEKQVEKENELKVLEKELKNEIDDIQLANKQLEDSLQHQIDLRQEELNNLREQEKKENSIRAMKEKQLELMRAMDDTRYSYITGAGEEVFTYDQEKVLGLQKDLAEMRRKEDGDETSERIKEEITQLQEELKRTKEINRQELEVLKLAQSGINEISKVLSGDIKESTDKLGESFDELADIYVLELREEMEQFTNTYQEYWDDKINRLVADTTIDQREINKGKLGGSANEKFGTQGVDTNKPLEGKEQWSGYTGKNEKTVERYRVKMDDNIEKIAEMFGVTVEEIKAVNSSTMNFDRLFAGQTVVVPLKPKETVDKTELTYEDLLLSNTKWDKIAKEDMNVVLGDTSELVRGRSVLIKDKEKESNPPIILNNPEFNEVENVRDFTNEMFDLARGNITKQY